MRLIEVIAVLCFLGTFEQASLQKSTSALHLSPIKYLTGFVHAFLMGLYFIVTPHQYKLILLILNLIYHNFDLVID